MVEAKALELPEPAYPPLASAAQASGEVQVQVQVQVIVDTDGKVIAASAISGHPLLRAASVKAARGAVFTPLMYEGKPLKLVGVIPRWSGNEMCPIDETNTNTIIHRKRRGDFQLPFNKPVHKLEEIFSRRTVKIPPRISKVLFLSRTAS